MAQTAIEWTWRRVQRDSLTIAQLEIALQIGAVVSGSQVILPGFTFNPWIGCTKVDELCANCYAATQDNFRHWTPEGWGPGKPRKRTSVANWAKVKAWNAMAERLGVRLRVFSASLADWLDDDGVPIEWFSDLLDLVRTTPNLDWLLLTKRPENWRRRIEAIKTGNVDLAAWLLAWLLGPGEFGTGPFDGLQSPGAPDNVWLGTSVGTQKSADKRIPELLKIPARVRFLSCEPLLGPVEFSNVTNRADCVQQLGKPALDGIHWVICGGESGGKARPMHPDWARSLRDQCTAVGVAFFFKQWGEWTTGENAPGDDHLPVMVYFDGKWEESSPDHWTEKDYGPLLYRAGKKRAGRLLDGVTHDVLI
jgi:protein gp37